MLIGQTSYIFTPDETTERLGGFNDIPPNTKRTHKQNLWRVIALGDFKLERRQMLVDRQAWDLRKDIKQPSTRALAKLLTSQLFIRRDLSGVILVLDHGHARPWARDAVWGYYQRHTFEFAACQHQNITSAVKSAYSTLVRRTCAECGFWTEVDSSD